MTTWLAVPFLFGSAVLGLMGLVGLLVGALHDIALSSAVFGAAAAVTAIAGGMVSWLRVWPRVVLRWGYPVGVLALGIGLDGVRVPVVGVVVIGVPVLALLVGQYVVERRRPAEAADEADFAHSGCR